MKHFFFTCFFSVCELKFWNNVQNSIYGKIGQKAVEWKLYFLFIFKTTNWEKNVWCLIFIILYGLINYI